MKKKRLKDKLLLSKEFERKNIVYLKSNKTHNYFKNNIAIKIDLYINLRKIFLFLFLINRYKRALKKLNKFVTKKELIKKICNKRTNMFC